MTRLSERIAADVLKASGSGLQNYTMNGARERIIEAASVADDLLEALHGLNGILGTAESNASGTPQWEFVSSKINTAREAIAKATGTAS